VTFARANKRDGCARENNFLRGLTDIVRCLHWSTRRAPDADTLFSGSETRGELVDTAATPLREKERRDVAEQGASGSREDGRFSSGEETRSGYSSVVARKRGCGWKRAAGFGAGSDQAFEGRRASVFAA
jgi:hypothetical protein